MKTETSVGLALGVLLALLSVALNALRDDAHFITSYPNLVLMLVPALVIYVASRGIREVNPKAIVVFGLHIASVSAIAFAALFTLFAWLWFTRLSVQMGLFVFFGTFAFTLIIGSLAAAACGRFLTRSA